MKLQIELKSAAIGLIIGAVAMFTLGDATQTNTSGRYQAVVSASPVDADRGLALIIDTQTGQAWGVTAKVNWHSNDDKFWDVKNN